MLSIKAPKALPAVVDPLSRDEITRILKACDQMRPAQTVGRVSFTMQRDQALRDRAIVLVLLDSGLRASELGNLTVGDVDLASGKITVTLGKGAKDRIAYLGKATRRILWRYLASRSKPRSDEPLFVTRDGHFMTPNRLDQLFDHLGERAEVAKLHPHRLRHTFATEFLRNGGNLLALQRLLGHSSLEMVKRYAAIVDADLERAHETGSPADKWRL